MQLLMKGAWFLFTVFLASCVSNRYQSVHYHYHASNSDKPFDAMPEEGWATSPQLSYRLYSYYPMDFTYGGFYQPYFHPMSRMQ